MKLKLFMAVLISLCVGCAAFGPDSTFTPKEKKEFVTLKTLESAKVFRVFALEGAGEFYKQGLMEEEDKKKIIKIGDQLQLAINTAADALMIYHQSGEDIGLNDKMVTYQYIFNDFMEITAPYLMKEF